MPDQTRAVLLKLCLQQLYLQHLAGEQCLIFIAGLGGQRNLFHTAHAEIQAITAAANTLGGKYLSQCTLYVTVEPCVMCAGAIGWAQLKRVVYGASDEKRGFTILAPKALHPKCTVSSGVLEPECRELMQSFFAKKR